MIPKFIHLCWLSGDDYPPKIKRCISSWQEYLSDYEIRLWNKDTFDVNRIQWVKEAFAEKKYAFAADYIRYWALYNYGGIYLDSDVQVLESFDPFLKNKSFIGFEYLNIPEAAVIGAEKNCCWIEACMRWYENKSFYGEEGAIREQVAPILVKNVIERKYNTTLFDSGEIQDLGDLILYPYQYFSPKNYFTGGIEKTENTVCIHHFTSAWRPKSKRKWTLIVHELCIRIIGKKMHDVLFRLLKPLSKTFNGCEC